VPPNDGIGSNDSGRIADFRKQVADLAQDHSVNSRKWQPAGFAPPQHNDLLSQGQNFRFQHHAWPEQIDDRLNDYQA
jgi:hypothetical protein